MQVAAGVRARWTRFRHLVQRPVRAAIAVVFAGLALWKLVIPGLWLLTMVNELDDAAAAENARLRPIMGEVSEVHTREVYRLRQGRQSTRHLVVEWDAYYVATPPGRSTPSRTTVAASGAEAISASGQLPPSLPKPGDPRELWYDPEDPDYLTVYPPQEETASAAWLVVIFLTPGVVVLVISLLVIRSSLRRRTGAPA